MPETTIHIDSVPAPVVPADDAANTAVPHVGARLEAYDGSAWDLVRATAVRASHFTSP